MYSEKYKISSSQLAFFIISFIEVGILPQTYASNITGRNTWLAMVTALCASLIFMLVYVALSLKFPGMNLIEINEVIYGAIIGKLISFSYITFFIATIGANLWLVGSFWTTYLMPGTPRIAFLIMFVFVCIWAVRKGIEVIARCSILVAIIVIFIVLFTSSLLLGNIKMSNFLPVLRLPVKDFINSFHILLSIPFCEMVVFLMVFPNTNKQAQIKRSSLIAVLLGGMILLLVSFIDTATLGPLQIISNFTYFSSIRQINIANVLTRLDILIAISLMFAVFIKITVFTYSSVVGIAQTLRLKSYIPLVIPIGIILIILGQIIFKSDMEQIYFGSNIWPFFTIPFEFLIPIISLFISAVRHLPKKQGGG